MNLSTILMWAAKGSAGDGGTRSFMSGGVRTSRLPLRNG